MNRYLEKIAEQSSDHKKTLVAGGLASAYMSTPALLGYHKLYHGTTDENAKSILKNGFDPSKGGSGSSRGHMTFTDQSKGKVHFSKYYGISRMYAGIAHEAHRTGEFPNPLKGIGLGAIGKGSVLHTRVNDREWSHMEVDKDMGGIKSIASTTTKHIPASQVAHHNPVKGLGRFVNKAHLMDYVKNNPGRFSKGVVGVAGGLGLTAYAASTQSDKKKP